MNKSELQKQIEVIAEKPAEAVKAKAAKSKSFLLDLRVQSPEALGSLGLGSLEIAPALIRLARAKGLDVIGVADQFSARFVDQAIAASQGSGITVIPGVVIRSKIDGCDDVNLLCLFDSATSGQQIHEFLHAIGVSAKDIGNKKLILDTDLARILQEAESRGAICIPTRMDKTPYTVLAIPDLVEKYGFRTFDLCYPETTKQFKLRWPKIKFQFLSFSNASSLAQVGSRAAKLKLSTPEFSSIKGGLIQRVGSPE